MKDNSLYRLGGIGSLRVGSSRVVIGVTDIQPRELAGTASAWLSLRLSLKTVKPG